MALTELDKAEIRFMIAEEVTKIVMKIRDDDYYVDAKNNPDQLLWALIKSADMQTLGFAGDLQKLREGTAAANEIDNRLKPEF